MPPADAIVRPEPEAPTHPSLARNGADLGGEAPGRSAPIGSARAPSSPADASSRPSKTGRGADVIWLDRRDRIHGEAAKPYRSDRTEILVHWPIWARALHSGAPEMRIKPR
jgi:hypothetical protein